MSPPPPSDEYDAPGGALGFVGVELGGGQGWGLRVGSLHTPTPRRWWAGASVHKQGLAEVVVCQRRLTPAALSLRLGVLR